jgi:hypothetical protein
MAKEIKNKPYKFNPKNKLSHVTLLSSDLMFTGPKQIPAGCKIFLYYQKEDRWLTRSEVDKIPAEDKALVWWIPALNLTNALRKVRNNFKTNL